MSMKIKTLYAVKREKHVAMCQWQVGRAFIVANCLSLTFLVLFFGCTKPPQLEQELSPRDVYLRVAENNRRLQTFRGVGRLTVESPQVNFSAPANILAVKPDSIFVKAEAVLGIDAGFFFADRNHFASFSPLENIYYYGDTRHLNALVFFEMELTYDEMMSGMIGTALPDFDSTFVVTLDGNTFRFAGRRKQKQNLAATVGDSLNENSLTALLPADREQEAAEWQMVYWVDAARGVVTKAEQRDREGGLYARQQFKRFRKNRGVWLPQLIQIERPPTHERVTVFYNHIEVNGRVAATEFVIRVPESAKRINLSGPVGYSGGE
ncbi:MAG: DUF4292 domain-containing protein [candidate division KSB1 bacterium]|nr:DUF4292 domain-containing protein [candidate division KSB1 bacterium]